MVNILDFYEKMQDNNILFSFRGEINSDLVSSILQIMETNLDNAQEEIKTKKKVYYVLVECLQNLYHHIEEVPLEQTDHLRVRTAIFMIGKIDNAYHIMTGNYIKNENIGFLEKRLNEINSYTKEELKEKFKAVFENGEMSAKGGGGLGLIDIARKTNDKYDFAFNSIDDKYSFFGLRIKISK